MRMVWPEPKGVEAEHALASTRADRAKREAELRWEKFKDIDPKPLGYGVYRLGLPGVLFRFRA